MKKILLLFVILTGYAKAQHRQIDSLVEIAKMTNIDSLKLNAYVKICDLCDIYDNLKYGRIIDSLTTKLITQAKNDTEKLKFIRKKLDAYEIIRYYYEEIGNLDSVKAYNERGLTLANSTKNTELIIGEVIQLFKTEEVYLAKQKQLEIDLANKQKENERKIKNISFIALSISLILICGIVFALLKIKKSNKIITIQKQEVEKQKHLIEEKQKEMLDSIRYAKRIQSSLMPTEKYIDKVIKKSTKKS